MSEGRHSVPEGLLETAQAQAALAGLTLAERGGALELSDGALGIHGDFARLAGRAKPGSVNKELVVRAAKLRGPGGRKTALDATAGLGEDSFLLASAGFSVRLVERNPVIAALLLDAVRRAEQDPSLAQAALRMSVAVGDGAQALAALGGAPDVVLLDPMFPARQKSAAVKKKLQLLQRLERPCDDEGALLDAAFGAHPRKVIVKRPAKGPFLAGRKPDYSLAGKAIRFDCFSLSR